MPTTIIIRIPRKLWIVCTFGQLPVWLPFLGSPILATCVLVISLWTWMWAGCAAWRRGVFKPEVVVMSGLSWQYPHFANICHLIHRQTCACAVPKRELNVKVKPLTSQSIYISTQPWPWPLGSGQNNKTLPYAASKQINIFKTEIFCCNFKKEKKTFIWAGFENIFIHMKTSTQKYCKKKKKGAKATGGKITLTTKNPNQSERKEQQHNAQPDIKRGDKGAPF